LGDLYNQDEYQSLQVIVSNYLFTVPLITDNELATALKLPKQGITSRLLVRSLMDIFKISHINVLYDKYSHLESLDFVNAILADLKINVILSDIDRKRIPSKGAFVAVANHPLGGIDGLILLKILLETHAEARIMANFILKKVNPLDKHICAVNPFENHQKSFNSSSGIRQVLELLRLGLPVGIFPAGEVSTRKKILMGPVEDKEWPVSVIKLVKKAQVPVLPVYFHAVNSNFFYLLAGIAPRLRTARLPAELMQNKSKTIHVRIGHSFTVSEQARYEDAQEYSKVLRQKVYSLGMGFPNLTSSISIQKFLPKWQTAILPGMEQDFISAQMERLREKTGVLVCSGDFEIFFSKLYDYPLLLNEIGRLREKTFREIGEGTNKALDTDEYDKTYFHLILWDKSAVKIAGAYRMGIGSELYAQYGIKGFYLSESFLLKGLALDLMRDSIELGRAFIVKEYQKKPMPLFLLWRGISKASEHFPNQKYLIGSVSISNDYCRYSRCLIVEYLKKYFLLPDWTPHVIPRHPYQARMTIRQKTWAESAIQSMDIKQLDKHIEEIEQQGLKIPILIKKYLLMNAKILGFCIDPSFNNALDVLMCVDLETLDRSKL
jgi:putative hemolysin